MNTGTIQKKATGPAAEDKPAEAVKPGPAGGPGGVKQKRAVNLTGDELKAVVDGVIKNYKQLFGDFSNDVTQEKRNALWAIIADSVSAASGNTRDADSVSAKFTHWKSQTKQKAAKLFHARQRTGGGELDVSNLSKVEEFFMSMYSLSEMEKRLIKTIGTAAVTGVLGGMDTLNAPTDEPAEYEKPKDFPQGKLLMGNNELNTKNKKPSKDDHGIPSKILKTESEKVHYLRSIDTTLKQLLEVEKEKLQMKKQRQAANSQQVEIYYQ